MLSDSTETLYRHPMEAILRQAGAIPFQHGADGLRVLLITSRGSGRWVIPKGGIEKGFTPAQAAEREAYEEAGVIGTISELPLGVFTYDKRLSSGVLRPAAVEVYALRVEQKLKKWPERKERQLKWMSIADAARLVKERGMRLLLLRLQEVDTLASSMS